MKCYIKIDGKEVPLIFGLKGLIYLSNSIKYNERISVGEVLKLGIRAGINDQYFSPYLNNKAILTDLKSQISALISSIDIPSSEEIDEMYRKSVGEMGISPADFFNMTEEEIELAYEGYLRRKELEANLVLLAINKGISGDNSPIKITQSSNYSVGSLSERKETFEGWNIQEED